jgi:hypothetical protein
MSDEGVWLLSRLALLALLILVTAAMRTIVGRGKRRGRIMTAGTIGGLAFGIAIATPISRWFGADVSAIASCMGVIAGWGVAWQFAKQVPREAR